MMEKKFSDAIKSYKEVLKIDPKHSLSLKEI